MTRPYLPPHEWKMFKPTKFSLANFINSHFRIAEMEKICAEDGSLLDTKPILRKPLTQREMNPIVIIMFDYLFEHYNGKVREDFFGVKETRKDVIEWAGYDYAAFEKVVQSRAVEVTNQNIAHNLLKFLGWPSCAIESFLDALIDSPETAFMLRAFGTHCVFRNEIPELQHKYKMSYSECMWVRTLLRSVDFEVMHSPERIANLLDIDGALARVNYITVSVYEYFRRTDTERGFKSTLHRNIRFLRDAHNSTYLDLVDWPLKKARRTAVKLEMSSELETSQTPSPTSHYFLHCMAAMHSATAHLKKNMTSERGGQRISKIEGGDSHQKANMEVSISSLLARMDADDAERFSSQIMGESHVDYISPIASQQLHQKFPEMNLFLTLLSGTVNNKFSRFIKQYGLDVLTQHYKLKLSKRATEQLQSILQQTNDAVFDLLQTVAIDKRNPFRPYIVLAASFLQIDPRTLDSWMFKLRRAVGCERV